MLVGVLACVLLSSRGAPPEPVVTLAFGGDVHGQLHVRWALEAGRNPFDGVAAELAAADLALINLETVVALRGQPQAKRFVYRAHPMLLAAAVQAGVDVVSVANNHAWDLGENGLSATLKASADAGLIVVGGGRDRAAAEQPAVVTIQGTRVAVVGVARVGPMPAARARDNAPGITNGFDTERMRAAVEHAATLAEIVVVTVHWGRERRSCPLPADRDFAAMLLDAGATIIVGHHPHRLQPIVHEAGTLVAWSIGNLVFDARDPAGQNSGVLTVRVREGAVLDYRWAPATITDGIPTLLEGEARTQAIADLAGLVCP